MAQQTINNGDAGLDARTKINTNFLELYTGKIGTATAGTNITWTVNSNGISINNPAWLTTARASNDGIGLNTAATNVTWTVNSSGISFNAGGYAGTQTAATNATFTLNSNGLSLSIGAGAPGGAITYTGFDPFGPGAESITGAHGAGTLYLMPFSAPAFQADRICIPVQISNASNSSFSATLSMSAGVYTRQTGTASASLSLYTSASGSFALTASGTVGSYSQWGGVRLMTLPLTNTYEANNYWMGIWSRTTTGGGAGMTFNQMLISQLNSSYSGILGQGSNNSHLYQLGKGISSVSFSTAMPNEVPLVNIVGNSSLWQRPPIFYFASSTL